MGISHLFKRFRKNAAEFEEYREGMIPPDGPTGPSQADRAAQERRPVASENTSTSEGSDAGDGEVAD